MENKEDKNLREALSLNSKTGGFAYSGTVIIYFILSVVISLVSFSVANADVRLYLAYLVSPVAIGVAVALSVRFGKFGFKMICPVKCKPRYYLIGLMLIFGLLFSLSWVNDAAVGFFRNLFGYTQKDAASYFPDLSGGLIIPALIVIAVLPAVMEELLFRGVILNCCEQSMGSIRTIFIVGFCFSLFHGSPEQTVYQFIAGCAFAFLAVRSRSILPSMMMHFINNALIIILQAVGAFDESGALIISFGANIALMVTSALSLVGAAVWLVLDKTPFKKCEKGSVKNFFLYAAAGIAAMGIVWICSLLGVG